MLPCLVDSDEKPLSVDGAQLCMDLAGASVAAVVLSHVHGRVGQNLSPAVAASVSRVLGVAVDVAAALAASAGRDAAEW